MAFNYYKFRIDRVKADINREIEFYRGTNFYDLPPLAEYLEYLQKRVDGPKQEIIPKHYFYDNSGNKLEVQKFDIQKNSLIHDVQNFKKAWVKIKEFHRIMKIKEFVAKLVYKRPTSPVAVKNRSKIEQELILGLKTKRFQKKGSEIVYDAEKMQIVSISCLIHNRKSDTYQIDWNE